MSDCHDRTREERAELAAAGRELLTKNFWRGRYGPNEEDAGVGFQLLERALDAIEWLDEALGLSESPNLPTAGNPPDSGKCPTLAVGRGPTGIEWKVE